MPPRAASPLRRIPFTLLLAGTIFITTMVTGTLVRPITPEELAVWGFGTEELAKGRWFQLVLAVFQILDPYFAISTLATVLALVGVCEYRLGTARTVITYALTHAAGVLAMVAVIKLFAHAGSDWGRALVTGHEVGASPGAIGALGAWLVWLPRRIRRTAIIFCVAFLAFAFAGDVHPWDVAHAVAFLAGLGIGAVTRRRWERAPTALSLDDSIPLPARERRNALAWIAIILGMAALLTAFTVADERAVAGLFGEVEYRDFGRARWMFLMIGAALLFSVSSLQRGEPWARMVALAAGSLAVVGTWQPGVPDVEHMLAISLAVGLVVWRRDFHERAPAPSRKHAFVLAAITALAALGFMLFGFIALRAEFVPPLGTHGSLDMALMRLRFQPVTGYHWHSPAALWFLAALPLVTMGSLTLALGISVTSVFSRHRLSGQSSAGPIAQSD